MSLGTRRLNFMQFAWRAVVLSIVSDREKCDVIEVYIYAYEFVLGAQ